MILESLWLEYKSLEAAQRQSFYDVRIFPLVLEGFADRGVRAYDLSIHTLGSSAEPVILAARGLNAPRVVLLGTAQTLGLLPKIAGFLEGRDVTALEVDRAQTNSVYQAVARALEGVSRNATIAADVTSGTKAMVAALAMQASSLAAKGRAVEVYYLNNEAWDPEVRLPVPGREQLLQLALPSM